MDASTFPGIASNRDFPGLAARVVGAHGTGLADPLQLQQGKHDCDHDPGPEEQRLHRDHPGLFDDESVDAAVPSFAITMIVPLVEMD